MSDAIAVRGFQRISNVTLRRQGQVIGRHGRVGDIPSQALDLAPRVGLGGDPRRAARSRQSWTIAYSYFLASAFIE